MELSRSSGKKSSFHLLSPGLPGLLFFIVLLVSGFSVLLLNPYQSRPRIPYLSPPQIQSFTFGFRDQAADFLWLRALQDFDYCEREVKDLTCISSGWLYRMLDLTTDLSPKFYSAYSTGALSLTVIVNDFEGASRIFDKGIRQFPNDWVLLSRAAYHALYEEKQKQKASELLLRAAQNGAPPWYYLLASRVSAEEGNLAMTEEMIRQMNSASNADPALLKSLQERLERARRGEAIPHRR